MIQSYQDKFLPDNALERFLVDGMISADWELRRLRMVETQLWQRELAEGGSLPDVYTRSLVLVRLERQKLAVQRSYYRALKEMQQIIKAEDEAFKGVDWSGFLSGEEEPDPKAGPCSPAGGDSKAPAPESGSFPPKDVAGEAPGPELGSFLPKDVASGAPAPKLGSFLAKEVGARAPAPELGSFLPSDVAGEAPPATRLGSFPPASVESEVPACPVIDIPRLRAQRTRRGQGAVARIVSIMYP